MNVLRTYVAVPVIMGNLSGYAYYETILMNLHYQIKIFLKLKSNSLKMPSCFGIGQTHCKWCPL